MIDNSFNTWLIEVNTNPCLTESSHILKEFLPRMIDDAFRLTIDLAFPSKKAKARQQAYTANNDKTSTHYQYRASKPNKKCKKTENFKLDDLNKPSTQAQTDTERLGDDTDCKNTDTEMFDRS